MVHGVDCNNSSFVGFEVDVSISERLLCGPISANLDGGDWADGLEVIEEVRLSRKGKKMKMREGNEGMNEYTSVTSILRSPT